MDEPTNYLDRDGLGALTKAIDDFKGGVIIISHNREFANAVTQEKWIMEKVVCEEKESISKFKDKTDTNAGDDEVVFDDMVMRLKSKEKTLTDKERKKMLKQLKKRLKKKKEEKSNRI